MVDMKKTYYLNLSSGEITQSRVDSPWNYQVEATEAEICTLRKFFDQKEAGDFPNFLRAHIPFREYHNDKVNDRQDDALEQIYQFIHQLGDDETKRQIESIGILKNN